MMRNDKKSCNSNTKHKVSFYIYVFVFVICVSVSIFVSLKLYRVMLIQGDSMLPSYRNMQFTVLDVHSGEYSYGDVIAFKSESLKTVIVKRIVACPGDSVQIVDGKLLVNGKQSTVFPESYQFEYAGLLSEKTELGEGMFFVIGDNIGVSKDSRYPEIGNISEKDIIGKICK